MRIERDKVISLCRSRGLSVSDALREAGVSRNAYYALARKSSILPGSIEALADTLGVRSWELLEQAPSAVDKAHELIDEIDRIVAGRRGMDRDNVRHTLLLLDEEPISRLRRALRRGRGVHIQSRRV